MFVLIQFQSQVVAAGSEIRGEPLEAMKLHLLNDESWNFWAAYVDKSTF